MKKRKLRKKKPSSKPTSKKSAPIPERRSMEKTMADLNKLLNQQEFESKDDINAFMQGLMGAPIPTLAPETPLEEAQELMYEAFDASTNRQRIQMAKQALKISPNCADAYVLLAEEDAKSLVDAKKLYEQGVAAGQRALGDDFEEMTGHFWGVTETRPYMRAREGLAFSLWGLGNRAEAVVHLQEMLNLNPNDNQGVRYPLLNFLLVLGTGHENAVKELLEQYNDDAAAEWGYGRALFLFRQEGDTAQSQQALQEAIEWNSHIPNYLLGNKPLPKQLPPNISFGDESEAKSYAVGNRELWLGTPGAIEWLRSKIQ